MQLFILRHGKAEPQLGNDAERALTESGRLQVAQVCEQRAEELSAVRALWASPFVRTQQTAGIVSTHLGLPVLTELLLIGDTNPQELLDKLQEQARETFPILLVSHQPLVGKLLNGLCCCGDQYPFGTASLACISAEVWAYGCAELDWLQHTG
ncbi:phosphohistidine phosphatase SixA [Microbulbifer sp. 2205BS26-8]|uniref:phosphohistidine phosphatase SixA n=1 Tax=Microbulbifer sp. 2205BS26-8 TaxID=3064386 RepID=UPI00273DE692|nr:phosphohistidine phosphatase SixA [Microbulbifer sp. 2205BS26-8]MDP5210743.1 phosphohistidine phosphatase SixA [Microbulbifer sp. 2205BS26-8]